MLTDIHQHTFTFSSLVMSGQCQENGTVCCISFQENAIPSLQNLRIKVCKYLYLEHKKTIKTRTKTDYFLIFKFVSLSMKLNSHNTS